MWATGAREESLNFLCQFTASVSRDLEMESGDHPQRSASSKQRYDKVSKLLARCYFKQAQWQDELKEDWNSVSNIVA